MVCVMHVARGRAWGSGVGKNVQRQATKHKAVWRGCDREFIQQLIRAEAGNVVEGNFPIGVAFLRTWYRQAHPSEKAEPKLITNKRAFNVR